MLFIFVQQKSYILKIHLAFYSWSLQTLKMTTLLEGLHFKCIIYFWIYVQLKLIITTKGIPQNKLKRQYTTHTHTHTIYKCTFFRLRLWLFTFFQQKSYISKIQLAFFPWSPQMLKMATLLKGHVNSWQYLKVINFYNQISHLPIKTLSCVVLIALEPKLKCFILIKILIKQK